MRSTGVWSLLILLVVSPTAIGQSAQNPPFALPDSVQMLSDVVCAEPGTEALRLDVFSPRQGNGPFPGVVFIACGGWIGGSKSQFWRQSAYLAERGFVSVSTQCRPAPGSRFPTQLNDAVAAVRWLRGRANEYKVDSNRVAVAGGSSGGHLAALVGTNRWNGSTWSGAAPDSQVQAVVVFNAVLDLPRFAATSSVVERNVTTFLGFPFENNPAIWGDASPLGQVGPRAAPFLLLHGTSDKTVPYNQSVEMQRKLREAGVPAELFPAEDADHGFFNSSPWYERTVVKTAEFLGAIFKARPPNDGLQPTAAGVM